MKETSTLLKQKINRGLVFGGSIIASVAMMGGAASASSYSSSNSNQYNSDHMQYGSYNSYDTHKSNTYGNNNYRMSNYHMSYSNNHMHKKHSNYKWVYDPYLKRWVLVKYNNMNRHWERCDHRENENHNRYSRSGNYWYGNWDEYSY